MRLSYKIAAYFEADTKIELNKRKFNVNYL